MLSMTHREVAIFDDACTVPTPCLLLPGLDKEMVGNKFILFHVHYPYIVLLAIMFRR